MVLPRVQHNAEQCSVNGNISCEHIAEASWQVAGASYREKLSARVIGDRVTLLPNEPQTRACESQKIAKMKRFVALDHTLSTD